MWLKMSQKDVRTLSFILAFIIAVVALGILCALFGIDLNKATQEGHRPQERATNPYYVVVLVFVAGVTFVLQPFLQRKLKGLTTGKSRDSSRDSKKDESEGENAK